MRPVVLLNLYLEYLRCFGDSKGKISAILTEIHCQEIAANRTSLYHSADHKFVPAWWWWCSRENTHNFPSALRKPRDLVLVVRLRRKYWSCDSKHLSPDKKPKRLSEKRVIESPKRSPSSIVDSFPRNAYTRLSRKNQKSISNFKNTGSHVKNSGQIFDSEKRSANEIKVRSLSLRFACQPASCPR